MFKQQGMTEAAAAVLNVLHTGCWTHVDDVLRSTGLSLAQCQLILTQLELARMAENKAGKGMEFKRCGPHCER